MLDKYSALADQKIQSWAMNGIAGLRSIKKDQIFCSPAKLVLILAKILLYEQVLLSHTFIDCIVFHVLATGGRRHGPTGM
jgi:hypothetical protein